MRHTGLAPKTLGKPPHLTPYRSDANRFARVFLALKRLVSALCASKTRKTHVGESDRDLATWDLLALELASKPSSLVCKAEAI